MWFAILLIVQFLAWIILAPHNTPPVSPSLNYCSNVFPLQFLNSSGILSLLKKLNTWINCTKKWGSNECRVLLCSCRCSFPTKYHLMHYQVIIIAFDKQLLISLATNFDINFSDFYYFSFRLPPLIGFSSLNKRKWLHSHIQWKYIQRMKPIERSLWKYKIQKTLISFKSYLFSFKFPYNFKKLALLWEIFTIYTKFYHTNDLLFK